MDLVNKVKQNEVVQQPAAIQGSSTTASASETKTQTVKTINMTVDKSADESKKNSEILDYLNSDEFKNLSEEEQLKVFKEKYGLGLSNEELNKLFTGAKKVAAEFAQRSVIEAGEDVQSTNVASSNDTAKAEIEAKKDIIETLKQQGIENPTQGDLYNYLTGLKANGEELTAEQAKLLKTFNTLLDNGFQGLKPSTSENSQTQSAENKTTQQEFLIPLDKALTKEFLNKTPTEKLKLYMDAYLTQNDAEYSKLSDKKKEKYCLEKATELTQSLGSKNLKKLSDKEAYMAISLLEDSNRKGEKIDNFADKALAGKVEVAFSNQIKNSINELLSRDDFKNKSAQEQMVAIGGLLFSGDEEYVKASPEQKIKYIEEELQNKFDEMGLPYNIINADPELKKTVLTKFTLILKDFAAKPEDTTLKTYMAEMSNPKVGTKRLLNMIKDCKDIDPKIKETIQCKMKLIEKLETNGIKNPTNKDVYMLLKSKKDLTTEEKQILKELEVGKVIGGKKYYERTLTGEPCDVARRKILNKRSTEHLIKAGIRKYGDNPEALSDYLITLVTEGNIKATDIMGELGKYYKPEDLKQFSYLQIAEGTMAVASDDAERVDAAARMQPDSEYVTNIYGASTQFMSKNSCAKVYAASMDNTVLSKHSAEALTTFCTKEQAVDIFKGVNNLGTVSDSNFSQYTKTFIEQSKVNGTDSQLYFAQELTNIGNAAVTEGVAAASNSIDSSARPQFNKIIENAISTGNYSPSETANIRQALSSGQISNETLSKTTPPASTGTKQVSATTQPAATNQTSSTARSTGSAQQVAQATTQAMAQAATIIKNTTSPTVSSSSATATAATSSTTATSAAKSSTSTSSTSKTQSSSSTKKQEALDNAAQTKAEIDKSIKEWEEKHNTKLTKDEISNLKSTVSSSVVQDIMDNPETAQNTKELVKNLIENSKSINDLYSTLVSLFGSKVQNKFVEALASNGNASAIHNFAQNNGSNDVIKDLYLKCNNSTLQSELLNLLSPNTVSEMLAANQIKDLSTIDYKVLKNHIIKNLSSMNNTEFNNYLKLLPYDERQALVKLRLNNNGYTGTEGGEIATYAENLGFNPSSSAESNQNNVRIGASSSVETSAGSPIRVSRETTENTFQDNDIEPFFDTLNETPLTEFTNKSDSESGTTVSAPERGSDEWLAQIRNIQTGVKVPPSAIYANYTLEDRDFDWDIGAAGPTKLPFGRDYDKQKRGTIYWG